MQNLTYVFEQTICVEKIYTNFFVVFGLASVA